jgi:putative endonuclease
MKSFYVYILASKFNGTLYIGMTSDLIRRVYEHKAGVVAGFTKTYGVKTLVYYEIHATTESAITREKQLKTFQRQWKIDLIGEQNPSWLDLYDGLH